jgi:hypothetical protein
MLTAVAPVEGEFDIFTTAIIAGILKDMPLVRPVVI